MRFFSLVCIVVTCLQGFSQVNFPYALGNTFHLDNRNQLGDSLQNGDLILLFSAEEKVMSNDTYYPFFQDRNLLYLTGFHQSNSVLCMFKSEDQLESVLFIREPNPAEEVWNGKMIEKKLVEDELGLKSMYFDNFTEYAAKRIQQCTRVLWNADTNDIKPVIPNRASWNRNRALSAVYSLLDKHQKQAKNNELDFLLAKIRAVKKPVELEALQQAIDITCKAQESVNKTLESLDSEYEVEAELEYVFRRNGAEAPGFPSIVGSGPNSCVLHYIENSRKFEPNEMLVVDIGARYKGYTADVTRTFSTSAFTEEQRLIYELVEKAQKQAISAVRPGVSFRETYRIAADVIAEGLLSMGIIKQKSDYQRYFMHGVSHYLGLNVHDIGPFDILREDNVITVEPGIYIPAGSPCDKKWWNIGVRLEDDVLVTNNSYRVLSNCLRNE